MQARRLLLAVAAGGRNQACKAPPLQPSVCAAPRSRRYLCLSHSRGKSMGTDDGSKAPANPTKSWVGATTGSSNVTVVRVSGALTEAAGLATDGATADRRQFASQRQRGQASTCHTATSAGRMARSTSLRLEPWAVRMLRFAGSLTGWQLSRIARNSATERVGEEIGTSTGRTLPDVVFAPTSVVSSTLRATSVAAATAQCHPPRRKAPARINPEGPPSAFALDLSIRVETLSRAASGASLHVKVNLEA